MLKQRDQRCLSVHLYCIAYPRSYSFDQVVKDFFFFFEKIRYLNPLEITTLYHTLKATGYRRISIWETSQNPHLSGLWRDIEAAAEYFIELRWNTTAEPVGVQTAELLFFINYRDMFKRPYFCLRLHGKMNGNWGMFWTAWLKQFQITSVASRALSVAETILAILYAMEGGGGHSSMSFGLAFSWVVMNCSE